MSDPRSPNHAKRIAATSQTPSIARLVGRREPHMRFAQWQGAKLSLRVPKKVFCVKAACDNVVDDNFSFETQSDRMSAGFLRTLVVAS